MNTLTQIFDWLLAASFRASLLTLAVLLIQAALHRHLTARMRHALWLPVLIVLLMPVLPQSRWSIEHVFHPPAEQRPAPPLLASNSISEAPPVIFDSPAPMPEPFNWQLTFLITWFGIAAGMLVFGGLSFVLTLRRFKQARQPASDELLAALAQISREIHLRQIPHVMIAPCISSPAVTGILRPTLLLPAEFDREFTPAEARLVLKHELMHLKRGDLPLNALMCVLMALHWFNPLLWIAFFRIRADREASCDAQVLQNATRDHRLAYGHALLKVETAFSPRGFSLGFVGIFQRGSALRSRIQSIAKHRAPHPIMKALITTCIALMTFFGATRAQQPKPAEDAPLIAIELKVVEFKQATDWNFDGKLPAEETQSFIPALLSPDEYAVQLRELLRNDRTNVTSYPRIVTASEKEVVIKSLVNQPSKDKDGKVFYVPIGLVCKFTPTLNGEAVNLGIDITDSDLFDPATGAVITEFKGDYANARSRVYKSTQQMQIGHSCVIAGWHDGRPQSKRPVLYIITPQVIDPKKGVIAASIPSDFAVGKSAFRPRDSMVITSMTRSAEMLTVGVDYELGSADEATAALYITSTTTDDKASAFDARQHAFVKRGRGSFVLHLPNPTQGLPHITFYDTLTHKPFGGIYFGTEAEAAKSQVLDLSYMTSSAQMKAAPSVLNPPDKPGEIVITAKETSIDPSTEIQTAKGDARCQVRDTTIQAAELICDRKAHQLKIRGPYTIISGGTQKHSSTSSESSAVLDLASGKLTTSGAHVTEILAPSANKDQSSSPTEQLSTSAAESKAAELRKARPQQYDFAKANLGDVLRFLATDASINFISLPDDNPINQRLMTFSINSSPFEVLETLCRANGLRLELDHERWLILPSNDSELIVKSYAIPQTRGSVETILKDISLILGGDETKPDTGDTKPSVIFKKEENSVYVNGTRMQHSWVGGYFKGLNGSAQSANPK